MIVYLDTSVILRVLLREEKPIPLWGKWKKAHASRLWRTEASRTIDRLRHLGELGDEDVVRLQQEAQRIDETLHIASLTDEVLTRAGESFPTTLGTLDGIHLATALLLQRQFSFDHFLTHDRQLGMAAQALGFNVVGIS